jgi:hypothetical protein
MRFMIFVKATKQSETGALPSPEGLAAMDKYNDELIKAGVAIGGGGLKASKFGARVQISKQGKTTVIDGPFTETKELVAGYGIMQCNSLQEAIEWIKRWPPQPEDAEIEIRPFIEVSDFPA